MALIHPSAIISPKAELAEDIEIGPFVVIEDDVSIGRGTKIECGAIIKSYTRIGCNNHIHPHAVIGNIPQDLKFHGEVSYIEIGDNNQIREFATINRGTEGGGGVTRIGNNNLLMTYTHVSHDCVLGNNIVMSNNATLAGHIQIQDGAIIGGLSALHQFVRVGKKAFVGGMSGFSQDLPPYMMAAGVRGYVQGPNLVGLRRMGLPTATISAIRKAFKLIWLSGIPRQEALEQLESEYADITEIQEIVTFIRESQRGIVSANKDEASGD